MEPTQVSHGDIMRAIGQLEGKMDSVILVCAEQKKDQKDLDTRTGSLETFRARVTGISAFVLAVGGLVGTIVGVK